MNCPVCQTDLSPLDLVSRNEHIELCLENGPSVVEYEAGQLVVKRNIPPDKQRKICPICSKTFQNIFTHFKSCALKNDLTPDLMQVHWFQLNDECNANKGFPRDLLESYIAKSTREGRVGEQVEFARQLLQTLPENPKAKRAGRAGLGAAPSTSLIQADDSNQSLLISSSNIDSNSMTEPSVSDGDLSNQQGQQQQQVAGPSAHQILMQSAAASHAAQPTSSSRLASKTKTRLELASKADRKANIELRIERELAAPRLLRYRRALRETGGGAPLHTDTQAHQEDASDECVMLSQLDARDVLQTQLAAAAAAAARGHERSDEPDLSKYFCRARLKDCTSRDACRRAECTGHDVHLGLDEFWVYYGKSLFEPTRRGPEKVEADEPTGVHDSNRAGARGESVEFDERGDSSSSCDLGHANSNATSTSNAQDQERKEAAEGGSGSPSPERADARPTSPTDGALISTREVPSCDILIQLKIGEQSEARTGCALDGT